MSPSEQPADQSEGARAYAQLMGGATRSGGLGWWWHTPEDTLDKLDPAHLVRDAQIYVLAAQRALEDPVLPLDYRAAVAEAQDDPDPVFEGGEGTLRSRAGLRVAGGTRQGRRADSSDGFARRRSPPAGGRAGQLLPDGPRPAAHPDQLLPVRPVRPRHHAARPALPRAGADAPPGRRLPPKSDEAHQLAVGLVRQRNKVCYHLSNALATVHATLAALPKAPGEEQGQRARPIGRTSTQRGSRAERDASIATRHLPGHARRARPGHHAQGSPPILTDP